MNNNKTRGISGLTLLIGLILIIGIYWFVGQSGGQEASYTYQKFQNELKEDQITRVEIRQNRVAPTGTLRIRDKKDEMHELHVSDVNEVQEILDSYDVEFEVMDVPQDSWVVTTLLPTLLMVGVVLFVITMMNRQRKSPKS